MTEPTLPADEVRPDHEHRWQPYGFANLDTAGNSSTLITGRLCSLCWRYESHNDGRVSE